jgi:hypothetical protein
MIIFEINIFFRFNESLKQMKIADAERLINQAFTVMDEKITLYPTNIKVTLSFPKLGFKIFCSIDFYPTVLALLKP